MGLPDRVREGAVEGYRVGRFPWAINTTCMFYRIGATVIDTGPPNQFRRVCTDLAERPFHQILLTHHHEDHSGNATRLAHRFQVPVLVPPQAVELLAQGFKVRFYQRMVWGSPTRVQAQPVDDEVNAGDGFKLRPIFSPGHSPDMTCFLEESQGWLFSGDLFVTSRPRYLRADEDVHQTISSLRSLLQLDFDTLFCGHRGVVADGRCKLAQKVQYLEELREEVQSRHRQGETVSEITRALLGKEDWLSWFSGGHFSKRNLVKACL